MLSTHILRKNFNRLRMADESTLSGGVALTGRWHLSQECERDLQRPLPLWRGSVSAGNRSESVKSEGSSVHVP